MERTRRYRLSFCNERELPSGFEGYDSIAQTFQLLRRDTHNYAALSHTYRKNTDSSEDKELNTCVFEVEVVRGNGTLWLYHDIL